MVRVRFRVRVISGFDVTSHSAYTAYIEHVTDLIEDLTAHIAPVKHA